MCTKINLLCDTALRVLLSTSINVASTSPSPQQLRPAGWELPPLRLAEQHSKCPLASPAVTFRFPGPPPTKKISRLQKIWRIFFSSTYGRLKGLVPVGQLGCKTPRYWILPDPIPNLIGSSGTPPPPLHKSQWFFSIQSQLSSLSFLFFSASMISL